MVKGQICQNLMAERIGNLYSKDMTSYFPADPAIWGTFVGANAHIGPLCAAAITIRLSKNEICTGMIVGVGILDDP